MNIKNMNIRRLVVIFVLVGILGTSVQTFADSDTENTLVSPEEAYIVSSKSNVNFGDIENNLTFVEDTFISADISPIQKKGTEKYVVREIYVTSTGYNSEVAQTDSTPFIAADGTHVYWGMVAANFLPFGTKIKIPDYYGGKVFVVHDRMNTRYSNRVDVWFPEKSEAINWGLRKVRIEIVS